MPSLPHLPLRRVNIEAPRRKRPGFGRMPNRHFRNHGTSLNNQVDTTLQNIFQRGAAGINHELILRVKLVNPIDEEFWSRLNLTLLGQSDKQNLILFSNDHELNEFKRRLRLYSRGPAGGNVNPHYAAVFSNIDEIGDIQPEDRIGKLLRASGITTVTQFNPNVTYSLDVELWHVGNFADCTGRINSLRTFVQNQGGRLTDYYIGSSIVLARIKASGDIVRELLSIETISCIDLPPQVSFQVGNLVETPLIDFPDIPAPDEDAVGICTLDSGVISGHPMLSSAIGEATAVPAHLGDPHDSHGHGTMVSGIALYGDVKDCIDRREFVPQLRLFSARVLNANNQFDDDQLITTQMVQAISYFKETYDCRVFNASLGDSRTPFNGGKLSPWSSILDFLARDLNIVIVVSAGNYAHEPIIAGNHDEHLTDYPNYLLNPPAKIIEPATGCNVITVGSISETANIPPGTYTVDLRPIAGLKQPSPFTRSGPGIGGAVKPELVEFGGNLVLGGNVQRIRQFAETSIISTSMNYLERLFCTDAGTSLAAPRTAHKAARLLQLFPTATANMIRALLASSAEVPTESLNLFQGNRKSILKLCGYGLPSLEKASLSEPNRVLLREEGVLAFDNFHIYEIPIPNEIYDIRGKKRISITLAFDPPVRHSRLDYLGTKMSFRLIRGKSLEEVASAFRRRSGEGDIDSITGSSNCPLVPKPTEREGGTLQKGIFEFNRAGSTYGNTYYLVVRCQREWANEEDSPQRYAVVATIEHGADVDLYTPIRAVVRPRVQVRGRR